MISCKYGFFDPTLKGFPNLFSWFMQLEEFGVYVREGLFNVRFICLIHGGTIQKSWEMYGDVIKEYRLRSDWPRFFIEAEYLTSKILEYREKYPEI